MVANGNVTIYACSADGATLAFIADKDTDTIDERYTVAATGGTVTRISGADLVFQADKTTNGTDEVYTVPARGGDVTKISASLVANGNVTNLVISPLSY